MTQDPKSRRSCLLAMAAVLPLIAGACEPSANTSSDLDGYWWSEDYGALIMIAGDDIRWIEQTPVSCLHTDRGSQRGIRGRMAEPPDLENGVLTLSKRAMLSNKIYKRVDEDGFAELCPNGLTGSSADPVLNFEVLWHTFDQHYAFFEERAVDWDAVYADYRPKITEDTSNEELSRALGAMLTSLKDGHVALYADGTDVVPVDTRLETRLRSECRQQWGGDCNLYRYTNDRYETFQDILETAYLKDDFETSLQGQAMWGRISDSIGYFRLDAMEGYTSKYSTKADLEAIESVLDQMLADIGDLPTMIIDVRANGGGHDTVSVAIANRFTDQRRVFGTKHAFGGGEDAHVTDMVITPHDGRRFEGEVAVLTSSETASAAEIFVMAMRSLPQVTTIGTATEGILSDEHYRTLPNDWSLSLSNEIYLTYDGKLFEGIGVPPDIEAPFLLPEDLERRVDRAIDTAIAILAGKDDPGNKSL